MPRSSNTDMQNNMDDASYDVRSRAMPQRDDRLRDQEGRFTSGRQTRGRNEDDDTGNRSGRGRGWFGDPQGHAEAGSHSHDYTRGARSRDDHDDDDRAGRRDAQGRFADDEADFGAWHAYGHNRGWHGYQRRGGQSRSRDEEGRFTSGRGSGYADNRGGGRDFSRDYEDDNRNTGSRPRDDEGHFTGGNRH